MGRFCEVLVLSTLPKEKFSSFGPVKDFLAADNFDLLWLVLLLRPGPDVIKS